MAGAVADPMFVVKDLVDGAQTKTATPSLHSPSRRP
jgi:hypothetical protein